MALAPERTRSRGCCGSAAAVGAGGVLFIVYGPALQRTVPAGRYLPAVRAAEHASSPAERLGCSGVRPLLMLAYWLNFQVERRRTRVAYHVVNVILHF